MRTLTRHLRCTRWNAPFKVHVGSPLCFYRHNSTRTPMEEIVIHGAQWDATNCYHRLGFQSEVHDVNRIKEHYRILAKHYHPDNLHAPQHAKEAFQNINEAYEYAMANAKSGGQHTGEDKKDSFAGFRFSDQEQRVRQIRLLGSGVAMFLAMTFTFIFIVARHNRERLQKRYLTHLLMILFILQLFPRILATAILFACHATYLVGFVEAKEQSETSVLAERIDDNLIIRVSGIAEEVMKDVVLQITVTECAEKNLPVGQLQKNAEDVANPKISTTLTFDAGVTKISLPLLKDAKSKQLEYHLKGVDNRRGFVLVDREFSLDL